MQKENNPPRRYEEHAYVLDFSAQNRSTVIRGREGIIVIGIGEDRLTLLEILGVPNSTFEIAEKIYIGKEGRTKVLSVLGKIDYAKISDAAKSELQPIVDTIVVANEKKFVDQLNNAQPLTPRIHALELIPGIGKTYLKVMLEERDRKKFESFADMEERTGLNDLATNIAARILEEITGQPRMTLFVKK